MKISKYLALSVIVAALAACNGGGTASSGTSSSTSASSSITPTGALLVPSTAAVATYTTSILVPASKTVASVAAVDAQEKQAKAVTVSLGAAPDSSCGTCLQPMTYTVEAAAVTDAAALNDTRIIATLSDGTTVIQPAHIRLVSPEAAEIEASLPLNSYVTAAGTSRLVISIANATTEVQTFDLAQMEMKGAAANAGAVAEFRFADDATATTKSVAPGETLSISVTVSSLTAAVSKAAAEEEAEAEFIIQAKDPTANVSEVTANTKFAAMSKVGALSYGYDQLYFNEADPLASRRYVYLQNASTQDISAVTAVNEIPGLSVDQTLWYGRVGVGQWGIIALDASEAYTQDAIQEIAPANCSSSTPCAAALIPTTAEPITLSDLDLVFDSTLGLTGEKLEWITAFAAAGATDLAVAISGPDAAAFEIVGAAPASLSYLRALPLRIRYVGVASASASAVLTITGNTVDVNNVKTPFTKTVSLVAQAAN